MKTKQRNVFEDLGKSCVFGLAVFGVISIVDYIGSQLQDEEPSDSSPVVPQPPSPKPPQEPVVNYWKSPWEHTIPIEQPK